MNRIENPNWSLRGGFTEPLVYDSRLDGWLQRARHGGRPFIPSHPKLGLHLGTHKPTRALADYLSATPTPPVAVSRPHPGFNWGMLGNDTLGDCVVAMKLHTIEDFHLDAGTVPPAFTDADAVLWYEKDGGYNPNDPSTDQGCDEGVAMANWQAGMPQTSDGVVHRIAGTVSVNPQNVAEVKVAISEFADLQLGVSLPLSAQGQSEWAVVGDGQTGNSAPGSWGGHGIPAREYDTQTLKVVTWGAELLMTWQFFAAYVDECHVVVTPEMLSKSGLGPSGVDYSQLNADIQADFKASAEEPNPPKRSRSKPRAN